MRVRALHIHAYGLRTRCDFRKCFACRLLFIESLLLLLFLAFLMLSLVFTLFVASKRQGVQMMMMNRYIIECCGLVGARRRVRWNTSLNTY